MVLSLKIMSTTYHMSDMHNKKFPDIKIFLLFELNYKFIFALIQYLFFQDCCMILLAASSTYLNLTTICLIIILNGLF